MVLVVLGLLAQNKMNLDLKQFKRFERQIVLKKVGISGQKKIFKSRVLIIGIGGLGCPLITYLAASGVGTIGIVDQDKIELSNLNRQTLFVAKDIGKFKVTQAKKYIKKVNNKIKIETFKLKVSLSNIKSIIKNYDIICDGTDNFETRYIINDECKKNKKILISAAVVIYLNLISKKKDVATDALCQINLQEKITAKVREFFLQLLEY